MDTAHPTKDSSKWSSASFRIFGEALDPKEITVALNLQPTHSHTKGDRRSPRYAAAHSISMWNIKSPLPREANLANHLEWLLDLLEPKLELLQKLATEYRGDFCCGFGSENGQGGFTLDSRVLQRLTKFGFPVHLDLYPPGPLDPSRSEAERAYPSHDQPAQRSK